MQEDAYLLILFKSEESLERRYALKARGVDVAYIAERVSKLLDMPVENIRLEGRYKRFVKARSLPQRCINLSAKNVNLFLREP